MKGQASIAAALAALCLCGCGGSDRGLAQILPDSRPRNVLIVSFDALRADALGVYGYSRPTSPNIDRFAGSAIVFDRAHAAAQSTPTSFAAAFTGRYPFRVFRKWRLIDEQTLAGYFRNAGYRTVLITSNVQLAAERGFDAGFDDFVLEAVEDPELLDRMAAWMDAHQDQPFLAWLHFISPHTPYDHRQMAAAFYDPDYRGPFEQTSEGRFEVRTESDHRRIRDLYDGEVFYADHLFGQLLTRLAELGRADDTLIVLTADHGEELGEHGQYQHNQVHEEVVRIPMMIRHPDAARGQRTDIPYSTVDLLPTLSAIMGVDIAGKVMDGIDLYHDSPADRVKLATAMTSRKSRQMAVFRNTDKLIVVCTPEYGESLYDLVADPHERNNLAPDDPRLVETLHHELTRLTADEPCDTLSKAAQGVPPETGLTDEQIEQLKSLGYIQ